MIQRLSALLAFDSAELTALYDEAGINARFQVTTVSNDVAFQVNEHLDQLPGVEIVKVPERVYLSGPTLAHVIGYLGLPAPNDIEENPDLPRDVRIGKEGVERAYEDRLKGEPGVLEYRVRLGEIIDDSLESMRVGDRLGDGFVAIAAGVMADFYTARLGDGSSALMTLTCA